MKKLIKLLFLSVFLPNLLLPLTVLAGTYQIKDTNYTIDYEGFVPCGKCVRVNPAFNFGIISDEGTKNQMERDAKDRCGVTDGTQIYLSCQLCHFFVMLNEIIRFFLFTIVPALAVLMLVLAGIMFFFAGGKPELLAKGKSLIKAVVIGLIITYGAYLIVATFLTVLGVADWVQLSDWTSKGAFGINCPIKLP